jgi:phosphoribosylglycinamide formyltransferase-1
MQGNSQMGVAGGERDRPRLRVAVLVSGSGTNLQAIIDALEKRNYPAEVEIVISNHPEAYALQRARKKKIPVAVIPHQQFVSRQEFEKALISTLDRARVDLVVLAGFMRVLSPHFVRHYCHRILNIHPALLPSFPGTHAIQKAWEYGVKTTGVTVHFVDEGTDTGPIVLQKEVPIQEGESLKDLEKRIHAVEHRLYPEAIKLFAQGKLKIKGRKVILC